MMIKQESLDLLREQVDWASVYASRLSGKIRGGRAGDSIACCPFHDDRNPSFSFNPAKAGLYFCHGCGASGDGIDFVRKIDFSSFEEAVTGLANSCGVTLQRETRPDQQGPEDSELPELYSVLDLAAKFFHHYLFQPVGKDALSYLTGKRGLSVESIQKWGLGYAPSGNVLSERLIRKRGISASLLEKAGLISIFNGEPRDYFRGQVIIPVRDSAGKVIAFGGRNLGANAQPKYINSPNSPVFKKSTTLFGLDRAKREIRLAGSAVLVEGYFDVIGTHEAGIRNVVAVLGTAVSEVSIDRLALLAKRIVFNFDGDSAGIKATDRAIQAAGRAAQTGELELAVLQLPKDPDDFIRSRSAADYSERILNAPPWQQWSIDCALRQKEPDIDAACNTLEVLDFAQREKWIRYAAKVACHGRLANLDSMERIFVERLERRRRSQNRSVQVGREECPSDLLPEFYLLLAFIHRPDLRSYIYGQISSLGIEFRLGVHRWAWQVMSRQTDDDTPLVITLHQEQRSEKELTLVLRLSDLTPVQVKRLQSPEIAARAIKAMAIQPIDRELQVWKDIQLKGIPDCSSGWEDVLRVLRHEDIDRWVEVENAVDQADLEVQKASHFHDLAMLERETVSGI